MADLNLTQAEEHALIVMEKYRVSNDRSDFPMGGHSLVCVDLVRGLFT